jgi:hypothetical protein
LVVEIRELGSGMLGILKARSLATTGSLLTMNISLAIYEV